MPDTGKINTYRSPGGHGIRLDTGNGFTGSIVSPYYDSMMTKLCTFAPTFQEASAKMDRALQFGSGALDNIAFLLNVFRNPVFNPVCNQTFIDETGAVKFAATNWATRPSGISRIPSMAPGIGQASKTSWLRPVNGGHTPKDLQDHLGSGGTKSLAKTVSPIKLLVSV